MIAFHEAGTAAVERPAGAEGQRITYNIIKARCADLMYKITAQKFEDPADGEQVLKQRFQALNDEIGAVFRSLEEEFR